MSKSSLKKNLGLQTIYQIITTITPLITAPYLARVLGPEKIGVYSYTQSIVNYFTLFAMLGFINYGTREIAEAKGKNAKEAKFNEIYFVQTITSTIMLLIYLLFSRIIGGEYYIYTYLQGFWIISCLFDVTWFFFGSEKYKSVVFRNIIIKALTVVSILLFVNNENDLWKYVLIMSASTAISQLILWMKIKQIINFKNINKKESIRKHLPKTIRLFIPYLAMSIYHIMDKTMLGLLSTEQQSGFYYNADKVANIPLGVLNGIGIVMLSKISSIKHDKEKAQKIINHSIYAISCMAIGMMFGIIGISKSFTPFFFGEAFNESVIIIMLFALIIPIKAISHISQTQYMIPYKKENILTRCVICGCFLNVILNIMLIKVLNLGAAGATIATIAAELIVCTMQLLYMNKEIKVSKTILTTLIFIPIGTIMSLVTYWLNDIPAPKIIVLLIQIVTGSLLYAIPSILITRLINKDLYRYVIPKK